MRETPRILLGLASVLFIPMAGRAQEPEKPDPDKKAMQALLQKADEEYRVFFKRPEKAHEFWAAIKFEVEVGKFDLAALHLKQLLAKEPAEDTDKQLLRIEEAAGMSSFLKLQTIRKWSDHPPFQEEAEKNVKSLIDRLIAALDKHLGDPERINKFIKQLDAATPEERTFAFVQLKRSRERAVPFLVEALRLSVGSTLHGRIVEAMTLLDPDTVPAYLEVLKARDAKDAQELELRLTLLDILKRRADERAVPYLWHLSASKMYPLQLRQRAHELLAFLHGGADKLPQAKAALTELAERYYQHKVKMPPGKTVRIWPWDGTMLATKPIALTARQAEEFFGLRYAREALDLDPTYGPAQLAFLTLMLERTYDPIMDQALLKTPPPNLQQLMAAIDVDLIARVLERGLEEDNVPVILAAVQALGERADPVAAKVTAGGRPSGLLRALNYSDRRVQFAAVKALLRLPQATASARVVEILRRFLASADGSKILIVDAAKDKTAEIRKAVGAAGYTPVFVPSNREIFQQLAKSADFDAIVYFLTKGDKEWPYLLTQLRADMDSGQLPILLLAAKDKEEAAAKVAQRYRNVKVYPEVLATMPEEIKATVEGQIREASAAKISAEERAHLARAALDILWRMARGEYAGHDLRPAQDAVVAALEKPDMTLEALEILSRLPGQEPQVRLAAAAIDPKRGKERLPAAVELNRHVQKYGLMIDRAQIADLKLALKSAADDPALRTQLALVLGNLRTSSTATGLRLFEFRPDPPEAPPPPKKNDGKPKD
ncbi:MAG: hypothetical protein L0Y72_07540 [Gemmataceae bacterium]|nr:hypothetical protein [Gemmataceae bacterium]MCI0738881.1 hypothetical protein [Gemmataceae bacterium]